MWAAGPALASAPAGLRAPEPRRRCALQAQARRLAASQAPLTRAARARPRGRGCGALASLGKGIGRAPEGSVGLGAAGSARGAAPARGRGSRACLTAATAGDEAATAAPLPRRQRALTEGERGEKTADGKPKPDERTVAYLVALGWFATEEEVVALLTRGDTRHNRFAFETAKPAADWLEARLGREPVKKGGLRPGAKAVKSYPGFLCQDVATLQRKWDALTLPPEQGGVGIDFSEEQAREAVRKHPQILGYAVDNLASGWSMLTATKGGLGLSPEEAHRCILRSPEILRHDYDKVMRRVGLLKDLGYADARRMVLAQPPMLNYKDEVVEQHVAWWKLTGLDHVKLITTLPVLLGVCSTPELQAKLDFLRRVAGMSAEELNNAHSLFTCSLDGRLRTRYFYALLKGRLARFGSVNTMMQPKDAVFLAMLQGRPCTERASELEVKRYQKLVASAKFVAWRKRQEAQRMRDAPRF